MNLAEQLKHRLPYPFETIAVAVTFSPRYKAVIREAARLSRLHRAKLILIHVGARIGGLNKVDSWAVGVAMNTHGVLEIILGSLAMAAGLINEEVFVAIVVLVVVSIITSAPMLKRIVNK